MTGNEWKMRNEEMSVARVQTVQTEPACLPALLLRLFEDACCRTVEKVWDVLGAPWLAPGWLLASWVSESLPVGGAVRCALCGTVLGSWTRTPIWELPGQRPASGSS